METYGNSTSATAEASEQARRTADAAASTVDSAKQTARAALDAGRTYAADAVNAAGKTMDQAKGHMNRVADETSKYVVEQPMKAVGFAAAAGFLLAMLVTGRRNR